MSVAHTASEPRVYQFGTSGYRSNAPDGFTDAVIQQITTAVTDTLIAQAEAAAAQGQTPRTVLLVGGDTREKSREFLPKIALWAQQCGLDVVVVPQPVPTPILAYAAAYLDEVCPEFQRAQCAGAILLTASHNPWSYGGFNFLTPDGAVAPSSVSKAFETAQAQPRRRVLNRDALGLSSVSRMVECDPTAAYCHHLEQRVRLPLRALPHLDGVHVVYDGLGGAGAETFPRLLAQYGIPVKTLHTNTPTEMPNPTAERLVQLASTVRHEQAQAAPGTLLLGLANDGDADRFGIIDEHGQMIDANDVLILVTRAMSELGLAPTPCEAVFSQATSTRVLAFAQQAGIPTRQTPVGFKYLAQAIEEATTPVLLAGESSGGLTVHGHVPEKDGLLANLLMVLLVAKTGKPLGQLLAEIRQQAGATYVFVEHVYHVPGKELVAKLGTLIDTLTVDPTATSLPFTHAPLNVAQTLAHRQQLEADFGTQDGAKFYFQDGAWLLCRASGTEPVLRLYADGCGPTPEAAHDHAVALLEAAGRYLGLNPADAKGH